MFIEKWNVKIAILWISGRFQYTYFLWFFFWNIFCFFTDFFCSSCKNSFWKPQPLKIFSKKNLLRTSSKECLFLNPSGVFFINPFGISFQFIFDVIHHDFIRKFSTNFWYLNFFIFYFLSAVLQRTFLGFFFRILHNHTYWTFFSNWGLF